MGKKGIKIYTKVAAKYNILSKRVRFMDAL